MKDRVDQTQKLDLLEFYRSESWLCSWHQPTSEKKNHTEPMVAAGELCHVASSPALCQLRRR